MAGRRTSLASLVTDKIDSVPGKSDPLLLSLPLNKLHCTRFNPRRNFGTDEELKEFGHKLQKEQLQPAVVVSKTAYLALWPNEAEAVGEASYVIANGERRYRASLMVGRAALEVVHREDVAASRATFLDAVQSENNDRKDLDPIERAIAIETMVAELGGADQVAAYYEKSKGWVSQQRKLLKLVPELQELVSSGEMPVRVGRDIAGLPAEEQAAAWQQELDRRAGAKEQPRPARPKETSKEAAAGPEVAPERFTAVNQNQSLPPGTAEDLSTGLSAAERFTAVNQDQGRSAEQPVAPAPAAPATRTGGHSEATAPTESGDTVPEPRAQDAVSPAPTDGLAETAPPKLPYGDGRFLARHLILKMPEEEFDTMLGLLLEHKQKRASTVTA